MQNCEGNCETIYRSHVACTETSSAHAQRVDTKYKRPHNRALVGVERFCLDRLRSVSIETRRAVAKAAKRITSNGQFVELSVRSGVPTDSLRTRKLVVSLIGSIVENNWEFATGRIVNWKHFKIQGIKH